jgi:SdrD B-like domain
MNIRGTDLNRKVSEIPSKLAGAIRKRRKFGIETPQPLESRQLLASFSVSYTATIPSEQTDFTASTSVPKFNPAMGTLDSVDLTFATSGNMQGTLINLGPADEAFTFQEGVNVTLSDGTTTLLSPNLSETQTYPSVAPEVPTPFGPFAPIASATVEYTSGPQFDEFNAGPGSQDLTVSTLTTTVITGGGGNIHSMLTTSVGATATVTYNYTATPVTLAGNVYEDADGTGALAPGDPPIPGVTILLVNSSGSTIASTTTANDGTYSFSTTATGAPIAPGTYQLEEVQPAGFVQGATTVGTVDGVTDGDSPVPGIIGSIVLNSGQNTINNNFGELLPVTLAGNVYEDADGTGTLEPGDPPIGGVTLTLVNSTGATVATTMTSNLGTYSFTDSSSGAPLAPGIYSIDETQPTGFLQGTNTVGTVNGVTDGSLTGVDQIGSILLLSGQNSINNNFGELLPVSISGTVYDDVLKAGLLLPGDLPIPGTTVTLFSPSGVVATTTTNAFGVYSFTTTGTGAPLPPNTYTLVETQPAGFAQGTNTIGTVNGVTDGTQPVQDIFTSIVLNSGQSSINNNFGELLNVPSPTVTTVDRFGVHDQPTVIYLTFSTPLDPTSAQNVANYQIFGPTDSRSPAPVPIQSAVYNASTDSVTLNLGERLQVHHPYTLTVSGLESSTGAPLIGSDGQVGSPFVTTLNRSTLAGFTDIFGTFVPINHGQLYPEASSAGYKHTRFVTPANLGSFATTNKAAFLVATSPKGEIPPIALKGVKPLPPAKGAKPLPPKSGTKTPPDPIKSTAHHAKA